MRLVLLVTLLAAAALQAQGIKKSEYKQNEFHEFDFAIAPKAMAVRPLALTPLPTQQEKTAGNAADFYRKAIGLMKARPESLKEKESDNQRIESNGRGSDAFYLGRLKDFIAEHEAILAETAKGAACAECEWGLDKEFDEKGIHVSLEVFNACRGLSNYLRWRARLAFHEGRIDDALRDLRTGLAMAKHVGEGPTLVTHLIGIAIASQMLEEVRNALELPGTPNLYPWLSRLPQPFFNKERMLAGEIRSMEGALKLTGLPDVPPDTEKALDALSKFMQLEQAAELTKGERMEPKEQRFMLAGLVALCHVNGARGLEAAGYTKEQIAKWSPAQIVAADFLTRFRARHREHLDLFLLPFGEMAEQANRNDTEMREIASSGLSLDFPTIFLRLMVPATSRIVEAEIRLERQIALLRTVELLRDRLAAKDAGLPEKLENLSRALPRDPLSSKPFEYAKEGQSFRLVAPPYMEGPFAGKSGLRFKVTVKAAK